MKKCYIVILNYKKWEDTVACLRSVSALRYPACTAVVVDNHSGNDSLAHIRKELLGSSPDAPAYKGVAPVILHREDLTREALINSIGPVFVQNDRNAGFAGGNNIVLSLLRQEDAWIWLLNPDMTAAPDALDAMIAVAGPATIAGAMIKNAADVNELLMYGGGRINYWTATISFIQSRNELSALQYISGGSLLVHASAFDKVGLLPEDYFLYWEESDWCFAARRKGYDLRVSESAICYDKISTTIGRGFLSDYFYTRNGLLFLKKYKSWGLPTALALVLLRVAKKLLSGQWSRARGTLRGAMDFVTKKRYENQ